MGTVLLVSGTGEVAGVGRHILDLVARGLTGWRVQVLTPPGPLAEQLPAGAIVDVEFGPQLGVRRSISAVRTAQKVTGAKIVHSHLAWADIVCALALLPVPHVSTEHGIAGNGALYESNRAGAMFAAGVHRVRMRRMAATVCVSKATAQAVRSRWWPPARMPLVVIPNGIDPPTNPARRQPHPPTIGYLGRLEHEKRPELLVGAFFQVLAEVPDVRLSIAGDGTMRGDLQRRARDLRITGSVDFPGWVDGAEWLAGVDVLAVTSVWENCSYAILEALGRGVGVVASPVGGNPELLTQAALADPEDAEAFAATLATQLRHPGTRPRLPDGYPTVAEMAERLASAYGVAVGNN